MLLTKIIEINVVLCQRDSLVFQSTVFSCDLFHVFLQYMGPALEHDSLLRRFDSDLIESKYSDFYDNSFMAFFSLVSELKSILESYVKFVMNLL